MQFRIDAPHPFHTTQFSVRSHQHLISIVLMLAISVSISSPFFLTNMPHHRSQARLNSKFNPIQKVEFGLYVSEHTHNGSVKTVSFRFCTVLGRESHGQNTKTSRRQKDHNKYSGVSDATMHRKHLGKIHSERWKKHQKLNVSDEVKFSSRKVSYKKKNDFHNGLDDFKTYTTGGHVLEKVVTPFLFHKNYCAANS